MTGNDKSAGEGSPAAVGDLTGILRMSLLALGEGGRPDDACRLAASACAALRKHHPEQWQVFNKLLHKLSPRTAAVGAAAQAEVRAVTRCERETTTTG